MPETLTESFCERCGTRYTFRARGGRGARLGFVRTIWHGLRHFAGSPASLRRSFDAARAEAASETSARQLEAFHRTFSFCLGCGQYVCSDCWDAGAGRCLTCTADPGTCVTCGQPRSARAAFCRHCGSSAASAAAPGSEAGPGAAASPASGS